MSNIKLITDFNIKNIKENINHSNYLLTFLYTNISLIIRQSLSEKAIKLIF